MGQAQALSGFIQPALEVGESTAGGRKMTFLIGEVALSDTYEVGGDSVFIPQSDRATALIVMPEWKDKDDIVRWNGRWDPPKLLAFTSNGNVEATAGSDQRGKRRYLLVLVS